MNHYRSALEYLDTDDKVLKKTHCAERVRVDLDGAYHWGEALAYVSDVVFVLFDEPVSTFNYKFGVMDTVSLKSALVTWADSGGIARMPFDEAVKMGFVR